MVRSHQCKHISEMLKNIESRMVFNSIFLKQVKKHISHIDGILY